MVQPQWPAVQVWPEQQSLVAEQLSPTGRQHRLAGLQIARGLQQSAAAAQVDPSGMQQVAVALQIALALQQSDCTEQTFPSTEQQVPPVQCAFALQHSDTELQDALKGWQQRAGVPAQFVAPQHGASICEHAVAPTVRQQCPALHGVRLQVLPHAPQ